MSRKKKLKPYPPYDGVPEHPHKIQIPDWRDPEMCVCGGNIDEHEPVEGYE